MSKVTVDKIDESRVNVWWLGWGRPNQLVEPGMQFVAVRSSVNIWHQADVDLYCKDGKGYHSVRSFLGSKFPSRRLWINGKLADDKVQGAFSDLWWSAPDDKTFVAQ